MFRVCLIVVVFVAASTTSSPVRAQDNGSFDEVSPQLRAPDAPRDRGRHTLRLGLGTGQTSEVSFPVSGVFTYLFDAIQTRNFALFAGSNSSVAYFADATLYWQLSGELGFRVMLADKHFSFEMAYCPVFTAHARSFRDFNPIASRVGIGWRWDPAGAFFQSRIFSFGSTTYIDFELSLELTL